MPRMSYSSARVLFASTSILTSFTPFSAVASSSSGPSCLHGPHHSAQKSTTTGSSAEAAIPSCSNVRSVTSTESRYLRGPLVRAVLDAIADLRHVRTDVVEPRERCEVLEPEDALEER